MAKVEAAKQRKRLVDADSEKDKVYLVEVRAEVQSLGRAGKACHGRKPVPWGL